MQFIIKLFSANKFHVLASRSNIKGGVYSGQRDSLNAYFSYA